MAKDLWLPKEYTLTDGTKIRSLLFFRRRLADCFDTNGSGNILLSRPELAQKWFDAGFLDESLPGDDRRSELTSFRYLNSHNKYALAPVGRGKSPKNKVDAIAFSLAIKESRKVSADVSFHDAVYVEQYSRLLPTWTLTPRVEDEMVLGTWLAGGVAVSTESFRWLTTLTGWMPPGDLAEIIERRRLSCSGRSHPPY